MNSEHLGLRPRPRLRRALVLLTAVLALGLAGGPALAAWLTTGAGNTTARAADMSTPAAPTTALNGSGKVVVSWQAVTLTSGQAVTGYVVRRTDSSGTQQVCSVSAPTVSCTDPNAVATAASYTVSAKYANWTSAQSPATWYDVAAPSTTLSTSSAANASGWWTSSPVGFTLNATDVGSGVKSIAYKVGSATEVTVNAATATFNVSTQGPTVITYRATDNKGNVEAQKTFTLKLDSIAPAAPTGLAIDQDTGSSATDGITDDEKPTITGAAEASSTVEIRIDGTLRWTVAAAANGTFTAGSGGGAYPPGSKLSAGAHTILVRAIDAAGNTGTDATKNIVVDRTNPTITVTKPTDNQTIDSGQWGNGCPAAGFCGTASDGTGGGIWGITWELKRKGAGHAQNACWNGTTFVTGNSACGFDDQYATGTTSWSQAFPYASLTSATYELKVRAIDLAGNNNRPDLKVTFTKP